MALRAASKISRNFISNITRRPISVGNPAAEQEERTVQTPCEPQENLQVKYGGGNKSIDGNLRLATADFSGAVETFAERGKVELGHREFPVSNTYKCLKAPLKRSKLASPFPEPVKQMPSCQVSDQEKAQQMFSDSRKRHYSTSSSPLVINGIFKRNYAKSSAKPPCEKKPVKKCGEQCKKFDLCNCEQQIDPHCNRDPKYKDCVKKEAPYPSFSEACYEEPYNKPSECKLCPWKPEDHPTFRPPAKKFHTQTSDCRSSEISEPMKPVVEYSLAKSKRPRQEEQGGNCVKFPFKRVSYDALDTDNPVQQDEKKSKKSKCEKKKRKLVVDCPNDKKKECTEHQQEQVEQFLGEAIKVAATSGGGLEILCKDDDKCNCPDVNYDTCESNEYCGKKRTKPLKPCPTNNLLDNRRYKKKKKPGKKAASTTAIIIPPEFDKAAPTLTLQRSHPNMTNF